MKSSSSRFAVGISAIVLLFVFLSVESKAEDYKLRPLKYNHPGLEVDLGVGLWAYPMPMDYDNDGDMDLLVGCPDKPSQGTYFFENPTQDPTIKMPVFKAGVRVGNGYHYMMLSRVDGEDIVVKPTKDYRRDSKTGKYDFSKPNKIPAPTHPGRQAGGRVRGNMWRYVDYDGDGDQDLVVGQGDWSDLGWDHAYDSGGVWRNGPLHGYVLLLVNQGTTDKPKYDPAKRLTAGGGDIDVYGWPSPNFADFDDDGDLDLLCGEFLDGFTYFHNTGSRSKPSYAAGVKLNSADGTPLTMNLQMITPTAIDWDKDGDLDLIVGDEDGRVALVQNTGTLEDAIPVFDEPVYFRQQADTLKFGALATPYVYDWDNDGDQDIVCGNTAGEVGFFENMGAGEGGLPKWNAPRLLSEVTEDGAERPFRIMAGPNGSIQGPCEAKWGYTTLSVADFDGDGDGDVIYNSILGRVGLLMNESGKVNPQRFDSGVSELPPKWAWWQTPSSDTLTQWRTTPLAMDFDENGTLDLLMLDQEGFVTLRREGGPAERIFVDEQNRPIQLATGTCGRSGRYKLSAVDWDGDSRVDLLVNSENATWYRNCEDRDGKIVLKKVGNLAKRNVAGHTSSPAVCDFDSNGSPDLLVGSENGRIYHIAHEDCVQFTADDVTAVKPDAAKEPTLAGMVDEEFVFSQASFKQCHASTICETTRGLVTAWFGGTKEGNKDVGIWSSYHDGQKWSSPQLVADGVQHDGLRYPCWNPVLFQPAGDAPTLLFFKVGPNPREWWGEMMVSYDRGRTFVGRKRLPESIDGPVRCKPLLLGQGKLLCGSSTEYDGWRVHFESIRLVDGVPAGTWNRVGPINDASKFNAIQPTLLRHADGRIQALCRTREDVIVSTYSSDGGQTWTPLQATNLPNPNSGIDAVTLADGRHLLVYNPLASGSTGWGKRSVLSLAISRDGMKWTPIGDLEREQKGEFSYPAIIQADDGRVHLSYTFNRTKIKHVTMDVRAENTAKE